MILLILAALAYYAIAMEFNGQSQDWAYDRGLLETPWKYLILLPSWFMLFAPIIWVFI